MSPVYLNPQHSSSMPFLEFKGDQFNHSLSLVGHIHDHATSNNNSYFSHSYLENHHTSAGVQSMDFEYSRHAHEKVEKLVLSQVIKPNDIGKILVSPQQLQYTPDGSGCSYNYPFDHRDHQIGSVNCTKQSKKCKPTKLRILQKNVTTTSNKSKITNHHDHLAQPQTNVYRNTSNDNNNGVRVCTDCHTTTTPLWRSGPQGPKSLCNACGIRQRKARRAAMAAAAAAAELAKTTTATTTSPMSSSSSVTQVEDPEPKVIIEEMMMRSENLLDRNHTLPIKKRSKITNSTNWNYTDDEISHNNGDFGLNSSKNYFTNKSQRVFPRDEEEGAILLMALSCGLACSS